MHAFSQLGQGRRAEVDFGRDILPILSDSCFRCHGPDQKARKAGLRLDTKEGAFRADKKTTVIVPGKSSQSELIRRITSKDEDEVMPPPDSNLTVLPVQIALLKSGVDEGAKWGQPWAFVPLRKPTIPATCR